MKCPKCNCVAISFSEYNLFHWSYPFPGYAHGYRIFCSNCKASLLIDLRISSGRVIVSLSTAIILILLSYLFLQPFFVFLDDIILYGGGAVLVITCFALVWQVLAFFDWKYFVSLELIE